MKHRKTLDKQVMDRYAAEHPSDALVVEVQKSKRTELLAQSKLREAKQQRQTLEGFLMLTAAQKYDFSE